MSDIGQGLLFKMIVLKLCLYVFASWVCPIPSGPNISRLKFIDSRVNLWLELSDQSSIFNDKNLYDFNIQNSLFHLI